MAFKRQLLKYSLGSDIIIYLIRVLIGFSIGYYLFLKFPDFSVYWAIISILLVISPEDEEAKKIAYDRMKANLIGSLIGLSCYFMNFSEFISMTIGIVCSILVCKLLNILSVARTSMVALIIVIIHENETQSYLGALDRFVCTTVGCLIGFAIVISTSNFIYKLRRRYGLISIAEKTPPTA